MRSLHGGFGLAVLLVAGARVQAQDASGGRVEAPVFIEASFQAALDRAVKDERILIADFSASWCPPCRRMEKEVWPADAVRAWLAEHGSAVRIDVDVDQDLSRELKIEAMPTMIAFKAGKEFDRIVGFRGTAELVAWFDRVLAGHRDSDDLLARGQELVGTTDVKARYDIAQKLMRAGEYDPALTHLIWLWQNSLRYEPSYSGVRLSFMLSDIGRLAKEHEPAREAFLAQADVLAGRARSGASLGSGWADWMGLCKALGAEDRILQWYDDARDADGRVPGLSVGASHDAYATRFAGDLFDLLAAHDRLADAARLWPDDVEWARTLTREFDTSMMMQKLMPGDDENRQSFADYLTTNYRSRQVALCTACFAAGLDAEAASVASELIARLDDGPTRAALALSVLDHVGPRPELAAWLDEADKLGEDVASLRARIAAAPAAVEAMPSAPPEGG